MKFDVRPGDRVLQSEEDPSMVLVYDGVPDWVRLPAQLGGARVNVLHGVREPCPCGGDHGVLVLVLDEPTGIRVAECPARGFLWHRPRP